MEYRQACNLASEYFSKCLGRKDLAVATENTDKWFFSPGGNGATAIGQVIVCVSKVNGSLQLVDMLSDEGFEELQNSTIVEIPEEFQAK